MCIISCIICSVLSASIAVTIFAAVIASGTSPKMVGNMENEKEAEKNDF